MGKVVRVPLNGNECETNGKSISGNHESASRRRDDYNNDREESDSSSSSSSSDEDSFPIRLQNTNSKLVYGAIPHLFLSKRVPDRAQDDLINIEEWILSQVSNIIEEDSISQKLLNLSKMLGVWKSLQPKSMSDQDRFIQRFRYEVEHMEIGDSIPVYVRQQNSTILISKLPENWIQVETFRPSLVSQTIMSTIGAIEVNFPETSNVIHNKDLLSSEVFAKQLHELSVDKFEISMQTTNKAQQNFLEHREVCEPFLVTDWILGLLVPASHHTTEKLKVVKKLRDEVNCKQSAYAIPFRRSGMWTSMKVVIQLKLLQLLGNENNAKLIYKLILLRVLAEVCGQYSENSTGIDVDLASQMLAKLGRRLKKVQKMTYDENSEHSNEIGAMWPRCQKFVCEVVTKLRSQMNRVSSPVSFDDLLEPIRRNRTEFQSDLLHSIPWLDDYIEHELISRRKSAEDQAPLNFTAEHLGASLQIQRYFNLSSILTNAKCLSSCSKSENSNKRIWLHDTEKYMKTRLDTDPEVNSKNIIELLMTYVKIAFLQYTTDGDPLGYSQMYLAVLKAIQVLDKWAVKKYPLLKQYESGINLQTFDKLLLPHAEDMRLLDEITDYFRKRDEVAYHPGILDSLEIKEISFCVRLAAENKDMIELRAKILADTAIRSAEKLAEVEAAKARCVALQYKLEQRKTECLNCKYDENKVKTVMCEKCGYFASKLQETRLSVAVYERPLPSEEHFQQAVIFELLLPSEIRYLRDGLAMLKFDLLGESKHKTKTYQVKWLNYKHLKEYTRSDEPEAMINLYSKLLPTSHTHYTKITNLDLMSPETINEDFIVHNGLDCVYHYMYQLTSPTKGDHAYRCTFQLESTFGSEKGHYKNLQWAITSNTHTQNRILAEFGTTLYPEIVAFGSLRAGHRIQLRNLFRSISSRELCLEKEAVLALILQTLWEVGPRDNNGIRDSHLDFFLEESEFSLEFMDMLEKLMEANNTNYANPIILLTAVCIIARILELNQSQTCKDKCYALMQKARLYSNTWIGMINKEISKVQRKDADIAANSGQGKSYDLNEIQLQIAICTALTFSISGATLYNAVIHDEVDLCNWFEALWTLHQLTEQRNCENSCSPFVNNLLKMARNVALKLCLESKLAAGHPLLVKALHLFSCKKWDRTVEPVKKDHEEDSYWTFSSTNPNIVVADYVESNGQEHLLSFDLLLGTFLVNGYPQSSLPHSMLHDPLFEMYFGERRAEIKIQGYQRKLVRTVDKFHGKHYEFEDSGPNSLIIREIQEDDRTKLDLLYAEKFRGFIGDYLIDYYSHWIDVDKKTVYFRRTPHQDSDYSLPHEFNLSRQDKGKMWLLYDERLEHFILNRKSKGFLAIAAAFSKIEDEKYVNIVMNEEEGVVTAKLPRYHLNFNVVQDHLCSVEYPDFKISLDQNHRETLIGLMQGLRLETRVDKEDTNEGAVKKLLIVPHGKLNMQAKRSRCRPIVSIELDHLRQPPFFVYEFDPVLKRIKADKSKASWLYLAALHAATSWPIPDQFTDLTGTEASVQILQSASVWSSSPYDEECLTTLQILKRFSPKRYYYGEGLRLKKTDDPPTEQIENTVWPAGMSSMAAYDGYAIIVEKLLEDSYRLTPLHPGTPAREKEWDRPSEKLQVRAYYHHLTAYNKAAIVKPNYFKTTVTNFNTKSVVVQVKCRYKNSSEEYNLDSLQLIAQLRFMKVLQHVDNSRRRSGLSRFLLNEENSLLPAFPVPHFSSILLKDLLDFDFTNNWLKYYVMASTWKEKHGFTVILSALAYLGTPMDQIANLHNISVLATDADVEFPKFPTSLSKEYFSDLTAHHLSKEKLKFFLSEGVVPIGYQKGHSIDRLQAQQYQEEVEDKIDYIIDQLNQIWPCDGIPKKKMDEIFVNAKFWSYANINELSTMIAGWYKNLRLKQFVESVEKILDKFYEHLPKQQNNLFQFDRLEPLIWELGLAPPDETYGGPEKYFEDYTGLTGLDIDKGANLQEAALIFSSGGGFENTDDENELASLRQQCILKIEAYLELIKKAVTVGGTSKRILYMSGISPRTAPIFLLQYFLHAVKTKTRCADNNGLVKIVGALGVLWSELKRFNRCLALKSKKRLRNELHNELQNRGHVNWNPFEYPEWLLLELELDIMIRPIQVEVALQMMTMPDGNNGVMQLNMGEGKTAVIVPMLCAALAGEGSLCRVTVLRSIFKTNLNILSFALGGLLNRRIYTFPYRRDMEISRSCLDMILQAYQECLKFRGVVLTLPEYRLSFRLMAYDRTLKANHELGVKFLSIENGLRKYARDIMDESDELLNVKYQLVYTVGSQVPVDGGKLRWITCQKLLKKVQTIAILFVEKAGSTSVECHKDCLEAHPEQFAYFRLLDSSVEEEFKSMLADEILEEFKLTDRQKQVVKKFLTQEKISVENFNVVPSLFKNDSAQLDEIRILYGYLHRGILTLALSKRWRVEYGVDIHGHRRMAVPFRAKDFAAERTEFGHPDLAIVLTHLSYYYSGLSDAQLHECLNILKSRPEAETIYASWLQKMSADKIPNFLTSYSSLNLHDHYQSTHLFEMLRKHKSVIDFWLSHKVFPKESKQFPGKIVMTAWDLCDERNKNPISGFSGTNDSSLLLPLPISQQDLLQLQDTNLRMEKTLLRPENKNHKGFRMGVTCREILESMKQDKLTVLIDAGALMLECDNEQVANLWLQTDGKIEAVVYFSKDNEPVVKCRNEHGDGESQIKHHYKHREKTRDIPLELSPYRERLETCGVFLDDQHTRGTDLKFPVGSKACVTIGARMRRDKLVQACMRMRKLEDGHSVTFYMSHEAHAKTLKTKTISKKNKTEESISEVITEDIINWVTKNTQEFNQEGLLYWAVGGKNYAQKLAAHEFHDSVNTPSLEKIYTLSKQCLDEELLLLKDIYGSYTETELVANLIPCWFESIHKKLLSVDGCYALSQRIIRKLDFIRDAIQQRCLEHIPTKTQITGLHFLEEEQEKELEFEKEPEVEEERQVVLPKVDAAEPYLDEFVKKSVLNGQLIKPEAVVHLPEIFENTSFWKLIQPECWGNDVFATKDFATVIKSYDKDQFKTDSYIRPVQYLVSLKSSTVSKPQLLILSPFEVNELLPYFRNGKALSQLQMFTARRYQNQSILINNPALQIPRSLLRPSVHIPEDCKALAQLLLASGNLYFATMEEQKAFARFLGYVPRPWTPEQRNAFEKEMIKKSGFLHPKYRKQEQESCFIELNAFQKDPIGMAKKIFMCRHSVISDVAHVTRLLNFNCYVELP
ncbi:unnamed protein product [Orchesella dallaii]|uniref:ubiquitinyl hydrolase 1 n=1 Tax=Orchesella dallaii TaxID=48710 RepID=A0ABP1RFH8_9HEXA